MEVDQETGWHRVSLLEMKKLVRLLLGGKRRRNNSFSLLLAFGLPFFASRGRSRLRERTRLVLCIWLMVYCSLVLVLLFPPNVDGYFQCGPILFPTFCVRPQNAERDRRPSNFSALVLIHFTALPPGSRLA